ncbi:MAG: hypothetical protein RSC06_10710 [Clostridia bacterium]
MINELYNLKRSLENAGIELKSWHQAYMPLPNVTAKAPLIRIWLGDDGEVCDLESLTAEQAGKLRKYGNNQKSFPAFNISAMYRVTDKEHIAEINGRGKGLYEPDVGRVRSLCVAENWIKGVPGQVQRSLSDCPIALKALIGESEAFNQSIIARLIALCEMLSSRDGGFRASLERCVFAKLEKEEDVALLLRLLFHKGDAQKSHHDDKGNNISIILDVYNWRQYGCPVASEQITSWLNQMLLAGDAKGRAVPDNLDVTDAFGAPFINLNEPMPTVRLSTFGVVLRSMFNGQPCQSRYARIDDGSYPLSFDNRYAIKNSLEWLAEPAREQVTWTKVGAKEIAFVYPEKLPKVSPQFAAIFGMDLGESPASAAARFDAVAEAFTRAFRGLPPREKPSTIHVFVLRKIDNARSKVVFTHDTTPEQLIEAADTWSQGCRNLPILDAGEQVTPFPLQVAAIVNAVWKQDGERADGKTPETQMKCYQGMELLLGILPESLERHFLYGILENASGLIHHLGYVLHGGRTGRGDKNATRLNRQKDDAVCALAILGLLLYRHNRRKEHYMEEMAYLLGQLLHVSDEMHTLYCLVVRKGEVPPQLAGGSMFVTACEMPERALAQLGIRMQPYIAWAKQYRYKDIKDKGIESWRAKWLLGLYEQSFNKVLSVMEKSLRFGDYEKAQLFIGYMSSLPPIERPDANDEKKEGGIDNEQ